MRVLIISTYRCGGKSFTHWIAEELNYEAILEPYNWNRNGGPEIDINDIFTKDNIVTKVPYHDYLEPIEEFIRKFDKAIGLTRDNIEESAESMAWADQHKQWHEKYTMTEEWIKDNEEKIKESIMFYIHTNPIVKKLPILQVTYENLFQKKTDVIKVKDYLGIDVLKHDYYLNDNKRLRNWKAPLI